METVVFPNPLCKSDLAVRLANPDDLLGVCHGDVKTTQLFRYIVGLVVDGKVCRDFRAPGCIITSRRELADGSGLSIKQLRSVALPRLKTYPFVVISDHWQGGIRMLSVRLLPNRIPPAIGPVNRRMLKKIAPWRHLMLPNSKPVTAPAVPVPAPVVSKTKAKTLHKFVQPLDDDPPPKLVTTAGRKLPPGAAYWEMMGEQGSVEWGSNCRTHAKHVNLLKFRARDFIKQSKLPDAATVIREIALLQNRRYEFGSLVPTKYAWLLNDDTYLDDTIMESWMAGPGEDVPFPLDPKPFEPKHYDPPPPPEPMTCDQLFEKLMASIAACQVKREKKLAWPPPRPPSLGELLEKLLAATIAAGFTDKLIQPSKTGLT